MNVPFDPWYNGAMETKAPKKPAPEDLHPTVRVAVHVTSGTNVRDLARRLAILGVGGTTVVMYPPDPFH